MAAPLATAVRRGSPGDPLMPGGPEVSDTPGVEEASEPSAMARDIWGGSSDVFKGPNGSRGSQAPSGPRTPEGSRRATEKIEAPQASSLPTQKLPESRQTGEPQDDPRPLEPHGAP